MFESIKAKLTTRNVLIGLGVATTVGALGYLIFAKGEKTDLSDEGVKNILEAAGEMSADVVEKATDVAQTAVDAVKAAA